LEYDESVLLSIYLLEGKRDDQHIPAQLDFLHVSNTLIYLNIAAGFNLVNHFEISRLRQIYHELVSNGRNQIPTRLCY
jgi:hypothetical protein